MGNGTGAPKGAQDNAGNEGGAAAAGGDDQLATLVTTVSKMNDSIGKLSSGLKLLGSRVDNGALDPELLAKIVGEAKGSKKKSASFDNLNLDEATLKDAIPVLLDVMQENMTTMKDGILKEMRSSLQGIQKDRLDDTWSTFKDKNKAALDEGTMQKMAELMEANPGRTLNEYLNEVKRPDLEKKLEDYQADEQKRKEKADMKFDAKNLPTFSDDAVKEMQDGKKTIHQLTGDIARKLQSEVGQPSGE